MQATTTSMETRVVIELHVTDNQSTNFITVPWETLKHSKTIYNACDQGNFIDDNGNLRDSDKHTFDIRLPDSEAAVIIFPLITKFYNDHLISNLLLTNIYIACAAAKVSHPNILRSFKHDEFCVKLFEIANIFEFTELLDSFSKELASRLTMDLQTCPHNIATRSHVDLSWLAFGMRSMYEDSSH